MNHQPLPASSLRALIELEEPSEPTLAVTAFDPLTGAFVGDVDRWTVPLGTTRADAERLLEDHGYLVRTWHFDDIPGDEWAELVTTTTSPPHLVTTTTTDTPAP
jgi:hypothetical protein